MSALPQVNIDQIVFKGGLDQVTPFLALPSGYVRDALNFECSVYGGYQRTSGYERFDGQESPTEYAAKKRYRCITMVDVFVFPVSGSSIASSGGGTAVLLRIVGNVLIVCDLTGSWLAGQTVTISGELIGEIENVDVVAVSPTDMLLAKAAAADLQRFNITAVPGVGAVRGVVVYGGVVYAFRTNSSQLSVDIYKSSSTGWQQVPFLWEVEFSGGSSQPAEMSTLAQGDVSAVIRRVVLEDGAWETGDARGRFIITEPANGAFTVGSATIGSVTVQLGGPASSIYLEPGGTFEFVLANFFGQEETERIYGVDGVNRAFEFDGEVLVPIRTRSVIDTPSHIAVHRNHLFLAIGSSVIHSSPGLPYDFNALNGAAEIATGGEITGMINLPGGTGTATLGIFHRDNTLILYGTSGYDWNLVTYNTGTGCAPRTLQNMSQTYAFDDRGLNTIQTSLQYGNFTQATLTHGVFPFIRNRIGKTNTSVLVRAKSQYRLFFDDGYVLCVTIANGKFLGCMPLLYPVVMTCAWEGKAANGADIIVCGGKDGFVYIMEKGTSFDGKPIFASLLTNYASSRSPRTLKRYRKLVFELTSTDDCIAELYISTLLGYNSDEYAQSLPYKYDHATGSILWDSGLTWDVFTWDNASDPTFSCYVEGTAENLAVIVRTATNYTSSFTLNSVLVHYTPRRILR